MADKSKVYTKSEFGERFHRTLLKAEEVKIIRDNLSSKPLTLFA